MKFPSEEFDDAVAELCHDTIGDKSLHELHELLRADRKARDEYLWRVEVHGHLASGQLDAALSNGIGAEMIVAGSDSKSGKKSRWLFWMPFTVVAAAVLMLVASNLNWFGRKDPDGSQGSGVVLDGEPTDDGIAVLVHADDVEWPDGDAPDEQDILSPGPLRFGKGLLELEFYSGARLIVEGPAELELVSVDHVICRLGRVRAVVPAPAHGFRVVAPQFELIDLGTEFGLSVEANGESQVQVFDGEVELVPPGTNRSTAEVEKLTVGEGRVWTANGTRVPQLAEPGAFPTFEKLEHRKVLAAQKRFARWQAWKDKVADDRRIAFRFDFEAEGLELLDQGPTASHGTIVGAEWTTGRWPSTKALEFKRPGDRVRLNLPGSYDTVTLSAWLRVDSLPGRSQGLLLTDGYEVGRAHWQLNENGNLRLGVRKPSARVKGSGTGYGSPVLMTPRQLGAWCFLCTVYDRDSGTVRHYYNGREVSSDEIVFDQPLQFGACDLGNWTQALPKTRYPVRNLIGRIDDLTIWKVALTGDEIRRMFLRTRP